MTPVRTPDNGGEATPMGTPVPAGQCPHCRAFLWLQMRTEPIGSAPAGPGAHPCAICPECEQPLFLSVASRPPVARAAHRLTALIPRDRKTAQIAPTERLPKPGV